VADDYSIFIPGRRHNWCIHQISQIKSSPNPAAQLAVDDHWDHGHDLESARSKETKKRSSSLVLVMGIEMNITSFGS